MALQGFLSQLLGAGASKSMADYNTQQQLNKLLREGWVPKGQGGIAEQPVEEEQPDSFNFDPGFSREGPEPGGIEAMRRIAEAINDPKLTSLINEMFAPTTGAEDATSQRFQGQSPEAVESPMSRLDTSAIEGGGGLESPIEDTSGYMGGILTPANQQEGIPFGLQDDPDSTKKPSIAPDGKRWIWSVDQNNWELVDAMPVSDATLVNPDPESRGWVNKQFNKIRSSLDGFVPSGEEAGHFLKPIAEQLNAMFGKSAPLDMDGYEMGPYHAQRLKADELSQLDEQHAAKIAEQSRATDVLEAHYERIDATNQQKIAFSLYEKLMAHEQAMAELAAEAREFDLAAVLDPDEIIKWEERAVTLQGRLDAVLDDTWAQWGDMNWWPFGKDRFALLPYKFRFWDWDDPEEMVRPLNLLLGLETTGEEPSTDLLDMVWGGTPDEKERAQRMIDDIKAIQVNVTRAAELRGRIATGGESSYDYSARERAKARKTQKGKDTESAWRKQIEDLIVETLKETQKDDPLRSKVGKTE